MVRGRELAFVETTSPRGRIWDRAPTIQPHGLLTEVRAGPSSPVGFSSLAFSARGDRFVLVDMRGSVYVFHVLQNRYAVVYRGGSPATAVTFASSPHALVLVSFNDRSIRCIDVETSNLIATLKGHRTSVHTISFCPSGQFFATTSRDRVIVWDAHAFKRVRTLETLEAKVSQASFSSDGKVILTSIPKEAVIGWDICKFKQQYQLQLPDVPTVTESISQLVFGQSSDGRFVAAGCNTPHVFVWEARMQAALRLIVLPKSVRSTIQIDFLPNSEIVWTLTDDGSVYFFHALSLKILFVLHEAHLAVKHISVGSAGRYLASIMSNGAAHLYDLQAAFKFEARIIDERILSGKGEHYAHKHLASIPLFGTTEGVSKHNALDVNTKDNQLAEDPEDNHEKLYDDDHRIGAADDGIDARRLHSDMLPPRQKPVDSEESWKVSRPLHKLTKSDSRFSSLDAHKLKSLLKAHGAYPDSYRLLIWRFLLRLPDNGDAFTQLCEKGFHPAFHDLAEKYPLSDRRLFRRLHRVISAVAHWCPLFAEVEYLPAIIFPFLRLYSSNDIAPFEITVCLLLNWCSRWFEFFPNPPVGVLHTVEALLHYHDSTLLQHFVSHGIEANDYAWPLLRSLMTEVMTRQEWVRAFDHVLSNKPSFFLFVVVAYLKTFHSTLARIGSRESVERFMRNQNPINISALLQQAYELRRSTPKDKLPADDKWSALTEGYYPQFDHYPKFVVDFQLKERERIRVEEEELSFKRDELAELQRKSEILRAEQESLQRQRDAIAKAEEERRKRWQVEEESRLREKQKLDKQANFRRKEQIDATFEAIRTHMQQQQTIREAELKRIDDEQLRQRAVLDYELQQRLEEEALLNLEFQMNQRLVEVETEKETTELVSTLRLSAESKRKERELAYARQKEQWRLEDEERRMRLRVQRESKEKLARFTSDIRQHRELEHNALFEEMEQDIKLARIRRERRLRALAQEELERQASLGESEKRREEILAAEEERAKRELLAQEQRWRKQIEERREKIIENERRRAALESEKRAERLRELEAKQQRRAFEDKLRKAHEEEAGKLKEEEKEVESVLLGVEDEIRKGRMLEKQLEFEDEQLKEKLAFHRVLNEASTQILADERSRFDSLREEMRRRFADEEQLLRSQQQHTMDQLVSERERAFRQKNTEWRQDMRQTELDRFEREYRENQKRLRQLREDFEAKSEALRTGIIASLADEDGMKSESRARPTEAESSDTSDLVRQAERMIQEHRSSKQLPQSAVSIPQPTNSTSGLSSGFDAPPPNP